MPLFQLFMISAIQGVTEFLPVSSSGHLILLPGLTGMEDQGQEIDVAVHVGTLFAVMLYFRRDTALALSGIPGLMRGRMDGPGERLAGLLLLATLPVMAAGLALKITGLDDAMRSVAVIGWATLVFGVVLYWTDRKGAEAKATDHWNAGDAVMMGLWQAVALIPGTSRSGITISAARFLGYKRRDAVRLAMLMSIPTIIASGAFLGAEVAVTANAQAARDGAVAALLSFLAALLALSLMMRLLLSVDFTPYVIYRVLLGVALLWIAYS